MHIIIKAMNRIVILDAITSNPGDQSWDGISTLGNLQVYERTNPEDVVERAKDANIILTNKVCLGRNEINQLPYLRYVGVLATGYNVVDLAAAKERNIVVTNVPAYSTESVAQMVFAHLLTVTNRVEHYAIQNKEGRWSKNKDFCYWDSPLVEICNKKIGIVGFGNIGRRVADIALAFGMSVMTFTSKRPEELPHGIEKCDMPKLLALSDVVTLHCPLTVDTHQMINKDSIHQMKPSAILINTGRGPLVNEYDVANALQSGMLAAYCADVMTNEPPQPDDPLLSCANAFITPHIAWATQEARKRLIDVATSNIRNYIDGHPQNVVGF